MLEKYLIQVTLEQTGATKRTTDENLGAIFVILRRNSHLDNILHNFKCHFERNKIAKSESYLQKLNYPAPLSASTPPYIQTKFKTF